jgi:hypothetical protein
MKTSHSQWDFLTPTNASLAGEAISHYMDMQARFVLFENGTVLFLKPELDNDRVIEGAMNEVAMTRDFDVKSMEDGHFTVWLASAVCVFISSDEAKKILATVCESEKKRMNEGAQNMEMPEDAIIGIAGREKAHRDSVAKKQVLRFIPNH